MTQFFPKSITSPIWSVFAVTFVAITTSLPSRAWGEDVSRTNVLVIMADDLGFSDLGCYGGEIETPHLDSLAKQGVRMTQFYNASRCCPTRASLLTGKYPHEVGLVRNGASLSQDVPTIAEVFSQNGYRTAMTGKWHLTQANVLAGEGFDSPEHLAVLNNQTQVKAFGNEATYPAARGFQTHYGVIWGIVNFFHPFALVENFTPVYDLPKNFYLTDAINDRSAEMIRDFAKGEDPFFLYIAHTAPHWPLHALPEDRAKYVGKFDEGYEVLRQRRYERQVAMGLIDPQSHPLPPLDLGGGRSGGGKRWEELTHAEKEREVAAMETHAAMIDRMDQGLGRVIEALQETGQFDNTLIVFLADNGASPELPMRPGYDRPSETPDGRTIRYTGSFPSEEMGQDDTWTGIGPAIANACNTPFRFWKKESWHGGNCTPAILHWPAGVQLAAGSISQQPAHVFDLVPTFLDAAQVDYPTRFRDQPITPPRGKSLVPVLRGGELDRGEPLFFEHEGGAAMRDEKWKIVRKDPEARWALYDLAADFTETTDVADEFPERVTRMHAAWNDWWMEVTGTPAPKAMNGAGRSGQIIEETPVIVDRPIDIRATVRGGALSGVVLAQGGNAAGYALHFVDGKPTLDVRIDQKVTRIQSERSVAGEIRLTARLDRTIMWLSVNGEQVAQVASPGLIPVQPLDPLSIGFDDRSAAGDYDGPNRLSGEVLEFQVDTKKPDR